MSDRPRLRLDFTAPSTPPATYSPYTYNAHSQSPPSPPMSSHSNAHGDADASSTPGSGPWTPASRRIIMGVQVTPSSPLEDDGEESFSLEVPGIVLTEPPHPPSPRIPSPPPKQVVLLAPTSLPIPTIIPFTLAEKADSANGYFSRPTTLVTFMQRQQRVMGERRSTGLRTMVLLIFLLLGGWHLWTSLSLGSLVEDAFDVI